MSQEVNGDSRARAAGGEGQPLDLATDAAVELLAEAPPFSRHLIQKLGLRGLQCGCGRSYVEGWLNTDLVHLTDPRGNETARGRLALLEGRFHYLEHDATEPFPLEDESFDWVYSEHFIEHVEPLEARGWLKEMRRLLRPGGHVRISTPDLRRYVEGYLDPETRFFQRQRERMIAAGNMWPEAERRAWWVNQIFRFWWHKYIYDFDELCFAAGKARFPPGSVSECRFREGRVPDVAQLDTEFRSDESLYVEIVRPFSE